MNADRILAYIAIFIGTLALLLLSGEFAILESLRPILVYIVLAILIILAISLIVIAFRKTISPELKALQELRDDINRRRIIRGISNRILRKKRLD